MTSASDATSGAPLSGRSVIVTRTREQAAALKRLLEALGAEVLAFPVIAIVDPEDWAPADAAIAALGDYDWVVLTSTNGVDRFLRRFKQISGPRKALLDAHIAVVGSGTADRLQAHGLIPALMPRDFRAEGLIAEFAKLGAGPGWRVLVARALDAREILPEALREMGCTVDIAPVYRTVAARPDPAVLERVRAGEVDAVTFTAGSTVHNFIEILGAAGIDAAEALGRLVVASVGPVTTEALRRRGIEPDVEADQSTMASLANAVAGYWGAGTAQS